MTTRQPAINASTRDAGMVKLQGGAGNVCTVPTPNTTSPGKEIVMPTKPTIPRVCEECGVAFLAVPYQVKIGRARFCLHACYVASMRGVAVLEPYADGSVGIPLRTANGVIQAHVIVDAADAVWANQWRWYLSKKQYVARRQTAGGRGSVYLHRELLGLPQGETDPVGDHIDRDTLNCRRSNLRIIPRWGNVQNTSSHKGSSSRYRGVSWSTREHRWKASLQSSGKRVILGYFKNELDAAGAVRAARLRLMPYAVD